ncbi:hypothetical protein K2173_003703 [Erythroxylum novogranatense]|uniref:9-cis-epoxycarotenoid dioxygenase n=1 Tax=Erythroxylum novogranatense TaxID=1862640 RepID=A0AAV8TC27_9ROSI|nr:hypothetical protein K2173_003703 [Erythroxylum novogranatense]
MQPCAYRLPTSSSNPSTSVPNSYNLNTSVHRCTVVTCKIVVNPAKWIHNLNSKALSLRPPLSPSDKTQPSSLASNSLPDYERPKAHLNPLQKVVAGALDMIEEFVIAPLERQQELPVRQDLEIAGEIPNCLHGIYLRNGPNPLHLPKGGHHFFDSDGMIHAVSLGLENRASYTCKYTRTSRLEQESSLSRPIFPKPIGELHGHLGVARLALFVARTCVGVVDGSQGVGVANAGLAFFNGRLLAMSEDELPYHVKIKPDGNLETVGRFTFNGQLDYQMIAHPKMDPITGELHALSYNVVTKPYLKYFRIDKRGIKSHEMDITLSHPTMIHDFAVTKNFVIIPDHQVMFKLTEMIRGGSPVIFDPNKPSRVGILSKKDVDESNMQWINVPNSFCFHFYNAWEEITKCGQTVIRLIGSCMSPPDSVFNGSGTVESIRTELSEIQLNLNTGESSRRVIVSGINLEAGQVNPKLLGQKARFVYLAISELWPKCCGIAKVDLEANEVFEFRFGGGRFGGEPCYVGADCKESEGYLMSLVRDEIEETSELVIVNASNMKQVCSIRLPTRVPYGFHGTFVSKAGLERQIMH